MVDHDTLRDYRPPQPALESFSGEGLVLYCGDDLPSIGTAAAVIGPDDHRLWTVVQRHAGARRVHAWSFATPDWLAPGLPIELTDRPAGFALPRDGVLRFDEEMIRPLGADDDGLPLWPEAPQWAELDPKRPSLNLGIDVLDVLAPIADGGLNLIVDTSSDDAVFHHLATRLFEAAEPRSLLVTAEDSPLLSKPSPSFHLPPRSGVQGHIAALQCTIALATELRQTPSSLAVVELPPISSPPEFDASNANKGPRSGIADIVARLGRHLVSTKDGRITTVLRLHVPQDPTGLGAIIDTLSLGDVDATLFVDGDGRFHPGRSHSRADVDDATALRRRELLQTLELAGRARDKSAIFGDQELTDAERRALEDSQTLRPSLMPK